MRLLTEHFRDKAPSPFVHADSMGHVDEVVEPATATRKQEGCRSALEAGAAPSRFGATFREVRGS